MVRAIAFHVLMQQSYIPVSNEKISILLHGPGYPPSSHGVQTLNVTIECAQTDESDDSPSLLDYADNSATVSWKNKAACQPPNDPKSPPSSEEPKPPHTGSGVGWFFTVYAFRTSLYGAVSLIRREPDYC